MDDEDYDRPPESSEDEIDENIDLKSPISIPDQKVSVKRQLESSTTNTRRSKRGKIDLESSDNDQSNQENASPPRNKIEKNKIKPATAANPTSFSQPLFSNDAFLRQPSQGSQPRKKTYGSQAKFTSSSLAIESAASPEPENSKGMTTDELKSPSRISRTPPAKTTQSKDLIEKSQRSPEPEINKSLDFLADDDEVEDLTALTASNTESHSSHNIFRRGSVSSLSSADSYAELMLSKEEQEALSSNTSLCPLCSCPVSEITAKKINRGTALLKGDAAREWCLSHERSDAEIHCKEKGWPQTLDNLEPVRVQRHIKQLKPIIERKQPSHYIQQLDSAITAAKGNLTKINFYIAQTAVETIHYGYYGPKGALMLSSMISSDSQVEKWLNKAKKKDKSLRLTASNARAVQCLLLPEILTSLVIEDMRLNESTTVKNAAQEARKILRDSATAGFTLHPDTTTVPTTDDSVDME